MRIIAGLYKNRPISTPKGLKTRPTSSKLREALFNICQGYIENARFLDLFAGSGAMGLEALSRGAQCALFIDSNRESIKCIQANVKATNAGSSCEIIFSDVFKALEQLMKSGRQFDIIYADPPYDTYAHQVLFSEKIVRLIDQGTLLKAGGVLFVEEGSKSLPEIKELTTLRLLSSRRMGRALLQQYQRE